jgi:hypothetical protein
MPTSTGFTKLFGLQLDLTQALTVPGALFVSMEREGFRRANDRAPKNCSAKPSRSIELENALVSSPLLAFLPYS